MPTSLMAVPARRFAQPFIAIVLCVGASLAAAEPPAAGELRFERDVRPILKKHCFHCHGLEKVEGSLDLRMVRLMQQGGDSGTSLVPGKAAESLLVERVRSGEMPPEEVTLRPTPGEIELITRWVNEGAKLARPEPDDVSKLSPFTEEERAHWSFRPINRPQAPRVADETLVRSPVDAFVLDRLADEKLSYSPAAARLTLVRRAYFDLLGLPPTLEQIQAAMDDEHPDAYERLVDKLLSSPRYGERWGRHWLDIAGYADSDGYTDEDPLRNDAWHYRDYVIRSFNAGKPFDDFIREQLAGDEMVEPPYNNLTAERAEKLIATGFLRMAPDGTGAKTDDPDLAKNSVVAETLKIVTTSLMGMTVGCAECHDHRYDPILQSDYYRLRAVFEPALDWKRWREPRKRQISLLTDAERKLSEQIEKDALAVEAELKPKLEELRDWVFDQEVLALPESLRESARAAGLAWQADANKLTAEQKKLLDDYPRLKVAPTQQRLNLFLSKYNRQEELKKLVDENKARAAAVRAKKPQELFVRALTEPPLKPPPTFVFHRGDRTQPRESVPPGDLSILDYASPDIKPNDKILPTTGRRTALAKRLTDGRHPLVPRVLVNRIWMHHFGQGIVATPGDFGTQGEKPSHPELLDFLAAEFVDSGWNLKHINRLIVTSTAYRQQSKRHEKGESVDAANRLLWRMNVRRVEAETLRDAILATSGVLHSAMFGPPIPVMPDANQQFVVGTGQPSADGQEHRRSVYVQIRRSTPVYMLKVFDAPQMEPNCELRTASTVAPQSLLLLNSQFVVEQAGHFAKRLKQEAGDDRREQIKRAWSTAFATTPSEAEVDELVAFLAQTTDALRKNKDQLKGAEPAEQALASLCQVLFGANRFLYID